MFSGFRFVLQFVQLTILCILRINPAVARFNQVPVDVHSLYINSSNSSFVTVYVHDFDGGRLGGQYRLEGFGSIASPWLFSFRTIDTSESDFHLFFGVDQNRYSVAVSNFYHLAGDDVVSGMSQRTYEGEKD